MRDVFIAQEERFGSLLLVANAQLDTSSLELVAKK